MKLPEPDHNKPVGALPSHSGLPSHSSNPIYSLENGTKSQEGYRVTGGYWGAKVTGDVPTHAQAYVAATSVAVSSSCSHDQTGSTVQYSSARQLVMSVAEKSVWKIERRQPSQGEPTPKQPSVPSGLGDDLLPVPGCKLGRPAEIEIADADWLAAEQSGLLGEPMVQYALQMFGPGCRVLEIGEATSCE